MNVNVKVVADNADKPVTLVVSPRGMCCCGWVGRSRWTTYGAKIDAQLHAEQAGHGLADPLEWGEGSK
jgi:hypothetical protein